MVKPGKDLDQDHLLTTTGLDPMLELAPIKIGGQVGKVKEKVLIPEYKVK